METDKENQLTDSRHKELPISKDKFHSNSTKKNRDTLKLLNFLNEPDNDEDDRASSRSRESSQETRREASRDSEKIRKAREADLHLKYVEFINFERQKKAEINSKKLDLLKNIAKEKVRIAAVENQNEAVDRKIQQTSFNMEELRSLEEEYTQKGVDLLKQANALGGGESASPTVCNRKSCRRKRRNWRSWKTSTRIISNRLKKCNCRSNWWRKPTGKWGSS